MDQAHYEIPAVTPTGWAVFPSGLVTPPIAAPEQRIAKLEKALARAREALRWTAGAAEHGGFHEAASFAREAWEQTDV